MGHALGTLDNGQECSHVKGDAQELVVGEGDVVANDEVKIPLMRGRMSCLTIRHFLGQISPLPTILL